MVVNEIEIVILVFSAMLLGGAIGIEREIALKPAGIRTHMFVAGAAALVVLVSQIMIEEFRQAGLSITSDPIRVIEAVIVGVSFIGAGTVIKSTKTHHVYYLTTAASILFTAAIGVTVGLNKLFLAISLAVVALIVNLVIGGLEEKFITAHREREKDKK